MCELDTDLVVEIYVDKTPKNSIDPGCYRIIKILEPFEYVKEGMINYLRDYRNCYDYILTYHDDILEEFENSLLSVTPTTWIPEGYNFETKEFGVSSLVGNKHNNPHLPQMDGYSARWELYNSSDSIKIPRKFFLSSHSPVSELDYSGKLVLGESKNPLFDTQFHIAIENTNLIKNAFSEKLIDCFQTKTIPIYYGPSNIGEFFNPKGILYVDSVKEIIDVCNGLNENTYESMREAIEDNYKRSADYSSFYKSLINQTKKILKLS
jgi:hypothetical protein